VDITHFDPDHVIQGLLDSDEYTNRVAGSCIYCCPHCNHRIRFKWRNFQKSDARSFLKQAVLPYFDSFTPDNPYEEQGFLDFHCPTCNAPTRIIFSINDYTLLAFHFEIDLVLVGEKG
jgi:hypothetical protein